MKKETQRHNEQILNAKELKNERKFVNYLMERKAKEKEVRRQLKLRCMSMKSTSAAPNASTTDPRETIKSGGSRIEGSVGRKSVSSSESEEQGDTSIEGLLATKDIQKLTAGNLDIKALNVDIGGMRRFVHTPKNAVRVPIDDALHVDKLQEGGQLLFNPTERPTFKLFKRLEREKDTAKE